MSEQSKSRIIKDKDVHLRQKASRRQTRSKKKKLLAFEEALLNR
jgi:hypothetical protein